MNSPESIELAHYRRDTFAAESFLAGEKEAPEVPQVDELDGWPTGLCLCCGERAKIPPFMHVCLPCHKAYG